MEHKLKAEYIEDGGRQIPKQQIVPIEDIFDHPDNPRQIRTDNYENLQRSLDDEGNLGVIVVNDRRHKRFEGTPEFGRPTIVGGHRRRSAERDLGYQSVACYIISVSPKREKRLLVRLNSIGNQGQFDDSLGQLLRSTGETAEILSNQVDMTVVQLQRLMEGGPLAENPDDKKPIKTPRYALDALELQWTAFGGEQDVWERFARYIKDREK